MPLRIGYYLSSNAMGGQERHVLSLIDYLSARHPITVFCDAARDGNPFYEELEARGLRPQILRLPRMSTKGIVRPVAMSLPVILAARRALAAAHLDAIHYHAGLLGEMYAPIVAGCMAGIPARILTLHNYIVKHAPLRRFIESRVLRRLDRIVAVSNHTKRELVEKKDVLPEQVVVVPNGVEVAAYANMMERREARGALGLSNKALVVGLVGRLHDLKGIDLMIEAVPLIKAQVPRLQVVLIGVGPEEDALKQLARYRAASDVVRFAGYRRDARRFMSALDLIALPSRDEANPLALLEAMACGKPVVGARVGGVPEVVVDGVTGLLAPPENVPALAEAVVRLLNDPDMRQAMGEAGRERVQVHFSRQAMLEKTAALYEMSGNPSVGLELIAGDPE
jgi:glycosyltransferase involved in cell wall biosynthesis